LANDFGAPVIVHSKTRDGSLRAAASELDIPVMIYESGEALRFDEISIRTGLRGINNVMHALDMLPSRRKRKSAKIPLTAQSSTWVRAPISGVLLNKTKLATSVKRGDTLGTVADPFGKVKTPILASTSGVVIGRSHLPLVNEGDAVIHIARFDDITAAGERVSELQDDQQHAIDEDDGLAVV
jgi:predicted deacylase